MHTARAQNCVPAQYTNFSPVGRRPFNMGFKMIAIINLVGTEYTFEALECLFFEIYAKNHLCVSSAYIYR